MCNNYVHSPYRTSSSPSPALSRTGNPRSVTNTGACLQHVGRDATVCRSVAMHSDRETLTAHTPSRHKVI